jgi:hypothetical protein
MYGSTVSLRKRHEGEVARNGSPSRMLRLARSSLSVTYSSFTWEEEEEAHRCMSSSGVASVKQGREVQTRLGDYLDIFAAWDTEGL